MRISIRCALILSLAALMPVCQEICRKTSSASTPKIRLNRLSAIRRPSAAGGASSASKADVTAWLSAFIGGEPRPVRRAGRAAGPRGRRGASPASSGDVAEPAQLLGDVRVGLGALELGELLLEHVDD